jgi:8-amino-7-oxononanoate synthase
VLDFTAILYLGFEHGTAALRPWPRLTTGVPAALAEPAAARKVAAGLAFLQGCEEAVLGPSTLHLFWDLFAMLAGQPVTIFLDVAAYPIAGWGVERAAGRGIAVQRFPHGDAEALSRIVDRQAADRRPVIAADGVCSSCGCTAPLADYLAIARRHGGFVVLDDTQALGLLGRGLNGETAYGQGGGGSLRAQSLSGPDIILVSSLAKSFGAPLAALCGSKEWVRRFQSVSKTRIHCSPPSMAALHAAERALTLNAQEGDRRRAKLARNVRRFGRELAKEGIAASGGLFPVQTVRLPPGSDTAQLYRALLARDIRSVLRHGCDGRLSLSFVLTANHRRDHIERAVKTLASLLEVPLPRLERQQPFTRSRGGKP